jgi:hypothetical protein
VCVNPTQVYVNLTQVCVNLTQVCVNPTQVCVNPTQVAAVMAAAGLKLSCVRTLTCGNTDFDLDEYVVGKIPTKVRGTMRSDLLDANRASKGFGWGEELTPPFRHARPTPLTRL